MISLHVNMLVDGAVCILRVEVNRRVIFVLSSKIPSRENASCHVLQEHIKTSQNIEARRNSHQLETV